MTNTRLIIVAYAFFAQILQVSGIGKGKNLRAQRDLQGGICNCNPYNSNYQMDCCGPACGFPDSPFFSEALCTCNACDPSKDCYDLYECCDPCSSDSRCFNRHECCDPFDHESKCFNYNAQVIGTMEAAKKKSSDKTTHSAVAKTHTYNDDSSEDDYDDATPSYSGKGSSGKGSSGKGSSGKATSKKDYDIRTERPLYSAIGTFYTNNRADASWNEEVGEIYPYFNMAMNGEDITSDQVIMEIAGNSTENVTVLHTGYCTRLEADDNVAADSTGIGYCHFSYCVEGIGKFVAQGAIGDPSKSSFLAIEGGDGVLAGASGYVEVYGVTPDGNFPQVVADTGLDPFKDPEGIIHHVALTLDEYFTEYHMPFFSYLLDTPSIEDISEYKCVQMPPYPSSAPSVSLEPTESPSVSASPSKVPTKSPTKSPSKSAAPSSQPSLSQEPTA